MKIKTIYNRIAENYDSFYKTPLHFVEEEIIAQFMPDFDNNTKILDVGCGTANMITVGQIKAHQYLGVDISQKMIDIAKVKYPDYSFQKTDGVESIGDGEFDLGLYVFGQINYMGLEPWVNSLCANLDIIGGQFLAVMYADGYKPDYMTEEIHRPPYFSIKTLLGEYGINFTIHGLSYPILGDVVSSYEDIYKKQIVMTESGNLDGCKYWILKGGFPNNPIKARPNLRVVK